MLIKNETTEQREAVLWSFIHTSQDLIKQINKLKLGEYELKYEVKQQEMRVIKMYYAELKELKRWANYGK